MFPVERSSNIPPVSARPLRYCRDASRDKRLVRPVWTFTPFTILLLLLLLLLLLGQTAPTDPTGGGDEGSGEGRDSAVGTGAGSLLVLY